MSIEIKRSIKPVDYYDAIQILEKRLEKVISNRENELIWFLEHNKIYTAGTSFNKSEILDNTIKIIKTKRGGKITCHSPGQLICYLVIDLKKRNKDIRKFIISIENSIIDTFKEFKITSNSDRKNIGIWINQNNEIKNQNKGPDFISIDGGEGGTGAAPLSFADHVSLPFKIGFERVYKIFKNKELTDRIFKN